MDKRGTVGILKRIDQPFPFVFQKSNEIADKSANRMAPRYLTQIHSIQTVNIDSFRVGTVVANTPHGGKEKRKCLYSISKK